MLVSWQKKYGKRGFTVIGITEMSPKPAEVRKTMRERGITYPVMIDQGERVFKKYGLEAHPTTIIIDRQGNVALVEVGFVRGDEKKMEKTLLPLLKRGSRQ